MDIDQILIEIDPYERTWVISGDEVNEGRPLQDLGDHGYAIIPPMIVANNDSEEPIFVAVAQRIIEESEDE